MRARRLALALALFAAAACPWRSHAQEAPRVAPVPLLWAAESGGHTVYLLGSFHLLAADDYPLSPDVDAAFADAESLLFELSPAEMASPTLATRMGQAALRTDGTRLDSELAEPVRRKLDAWARANAERLARAGMSAQTLQMFEPWFVGLAVGILGMTDAGLDPALGLDRHFAAAATAAGKPADGLETGDQQIAFLDGMDRAEQAQFLDEALDDAMPGNAENMTLHALWRAGDADAMWEHLGVDMQRDYPRLYRRINVERNAAWLPVVERRLQGAGDDDTLLVVGALHLLGPDGLVERLRAAGYDVRRVCSACTPAGTSTMQSTGQAGTHSSQPVHSGSSTACMSFAAPTMASTGQAWMHLVQPMQSSSTTSATCAALCAPRARSKGVAGTPSTRASARAPASPPGGQRSGPASPRAIASA